MNEFMKTAKALAHENLFTNAGGPFGACVVKDGKIVGRGSNQVLKKIDPTAHAEVEAIRDACKKLQTFDLSGCELYTSSYPCPMCLSAIMWSNIKVVFFGNTKEDTRAIGFRDDFIYDFISLLLEEKEDENVLKMIPLNREETIKEYEEFIKKEDKIMY